MERVGNSNGCGFLYVYIDYLLSFFLDIALNVMDDVDNRARYRMF